MSGRGAECDEGVKRGCRGQREAANGSREERMAERTGDKNGRQIRDRKETTTEVQKRTVSCTKIKTIETRSDVYVYLSKKRCLQYLFKYSPLSNYKPSSTCYLYLRRGVDEIT